MRTYAFPANKILAVGLFMSLCFHIVATQLIVIIFPSMQESPKPSIVFHGSFLKSLDVSPPTGKDVTLSAGTNSHWKDVGTAPYEHTQILKPQSQESRSRLTKETQKSIFALSPEEQKVSSHPDDIGIDTQTKPYEPLRFQRQ